MRTNFVHNRINSSASRPKTSWRPPVRSNQAGYRNRFNRQYNYVLNERIQYPEFRLIDDRGKQIGVLSRSDGLNLAKDKGLDLVLITGSVNPPIVKLINFNKFLYQKNKKEKEAKKGAKKSLIKNIKLSLFIGKGDLERLVNKAKKFIDEGHQVRIALLLKGRELGKKPLAFNLMNEFIKLTGEVNIALPPKIQGRMILAIINKKKI